MSEAAKFDPKRRLCPDGDCIGIIGSDGRCRVCGRSASGAKDEAPPAGFEAVESLSEDEDEDEDGHEDGDGEARAKAAPGAAFDPHRRLCPDGDCLGVIGADGVCNVCGKKPE